MYYSHIKGLTEETVKKHSITTLEQYMADTERNIEFEKDTIKELQERKKLLEKELKRKKKIPTKNVVTINKYKNPWDDHTEIDFYVDAIDAKGSLIREISYQKYSYSQRSSLAQVIDEAYEKYSFEKIISNMSLTKAITKKYQVEIVPYITR